MRLLIAILVFSIAPLYKCYPQETKKDPSFEDVLSLKTPGTPLISPDGRHIAFTVRTTDWENNRFDSEIWISKDGGEPFQLTNTAEGSSGTLRWSPDSKLLGFLANRGDMNQIHIIRVAGGEATAVTSEKEGVQDFEWSPDMKTIAYTRPVKNEDREKLEKKYGKYAVEDDEFSFRELMVMDFNPGLLNKTDLPDYTLDSLEKERSKPRELIGKPDFFIGGFEWSPDGKWMAINRRPDNQLLSFFDSDIYLLDVSTRNLTPLVQNTSFDGFMTWSPDSKSIMYLSHVDNRTSNFYLNEQYFRIDIDGKNKSELAGDFDENIYGFKWRPSGIYGATSQKTKRRLVRIDANSGKVEVLNAKPDKIFGFSLDKTGQKIAFSGESNNSLREIFMGDKDLKSTKKISDFTAQISGWKVAQSEVISWKSEDGTTIEGVLHKPMDYDAAKEYPLLVVIHGGPTGIDRPAPVLSYVYPVNQWLNKGALVLRPNYRGSAGYGEDFRSLNVRNLGVGDAWDVLSGVNYLVNQGMVDADKMGAMGWSQGGYISAFLTTNTDRFKAISVGAGISDWMTYYVNTDIHPFTRQYLKANPWDDPEIYAKTSPMTNITRAKTPTLIQHGEFDKRVPIPNAYQLYQGLQDVGVETKLIVYKGFGHGINKPKERLAAMQHNWDWFAKYIWAEE